MPRPRRNRNLIFKGFALNWNKRKIKREFHISERTYFRVKDAWEKLAQEDRDRIIREATQEEKAKAKLEDYEYVQRWIALMKSERLRSWKSRLNLCTKVWEILNRKNPEHWTYDDIKLKVIPTLRKGRKSIFTYLVAIRSIRPDFKHGLKAIKTKGEKPKINFAWRIAFKQIVRKQLLQEYFKASTIQSEYPLRDEALVRCHVEWGCREGKSGFIRYRKGEVSETEIGGILGVRWEDIDWEAATISIYETKTGGGIKWLDCPMKLFGDSAYNMLKQYWLKEGKPQSGRIFNINIDELDAIHRRIRKHFEEKGHEWAKVIKPHFDRKLHASLCKHAGIPLEIVAGQAPHGIVGVGWEDISTLMKFYIAIADKELKESRVKARQLQI